MRRLSVEYRVFRRSAAKLGIRSPSDDPPLLPLSSIPVVGPLLDSGPGDDAQPPPSPDPQPPPGPPPGSGSGSGNGYHGGGNGGGNSPPISLSSGGGPTPPAPVTPWPSPPPVQPPTPSSAQSTSTSGSPTSPLSSGVGADFLGTGGGQSAPDNAAVSPSVNSMTPDIFTPEATGILSPSQYSQGSGVTVVATATPLPVSTTPALSSRKQLSGGVITGITVACLFSLLALVLLVIRRRSIAHRLELRRRWWLSHSHSDHSFSFFNRGSPRTAAGSSGEPSTNRQSARSSFATNFDQGLMFRISSPSGFSVGPLPDVPPTAEVRERNSVLVSTGGSVVRRESLNSMLSNDSNPDGQYLTVSTGQNSLGPSTPMSVRPFSPSESFAFPKPPAPSTSTADSFFISGNPTLISSLSSATTLVHLSTPPRAFASDFPSPPVSMSFPPDNSAPSLSLSPSADVVNPFIAPFADPAESEFSQVELVRRPFAPLLGDELAVHPGDRVCIFRVFDDGWAFVEKLANAPGKRHERGLIPIDCFRQIDQSLPTFLAEKRFSHASNKLVAYAF